MGTLAQREKATGRRGRKLGFWILGEESGVVEKWLSTIQQTCCEAEEEGKGKVGKTGRVASGSTGPVLTVDGDGETFSHPCTLQALHRPRAGLQPCMS